MMLMGGNKTYSKGSDNDSFYFEKNKSGSKKAYFPLAGDEDKTPSAVHLYPVYHKRAKLPKK